MSTNKSFQSNKTSKSSNPVHNEKRESRRLKRDIAGEGSSLKHQKDKTVNPSDSDV
ncbi:hypothetical protein ACFORL_05165 [Legionella dresdenensis]|uniref:Uncharacterized protein n=1 Tax=Legionella dresdenensis TaxID=450200 RepID=A0ABV8CDR5_9GAMM